MKPQKITPRIRQRIVQLRADNVPYRIIGRMLGLSASGVQGAFRQTMPKAVSPDAILEEQHVVELDRLRDRFADADASEERPVFGIRFEPCDPYVCPECDRMTTYRPCVACAARHGHVERLPDLPGPDPVNWPTFDIVAMLANDRPERTEPVEEPDFQPFDLDEELAFA